MESKKIFIIALILIGLVGCSQTKETVDFQVTVESPTEAITNTLTNIEDNTPEVSLGNWDGSTYKNDFLNLSYTLPENWIRYSDDEIMKLMNLGTELAYSDNEAMKKILDLTSVYYLFAQNENNYSNVSVFSEKVILDITVEQYLEQVKKQLLTQPDFKFVPGEMSSTHISGIEYKTLDVKVDDFDMIQKYLIRKEGDYFIGINVTSAIGSVNEIEEIINCFK